MEHSWCALIARVQPQQHKQWRNALLPFVVPGVQFAASQGHVLEVFELSCLGALPGLSRGRELTPQYAGLMPDDVQCESFIVASPDQAIS
jgi:hypothetical protein